MKTINEFDFFELHYGKDGQPTDASELTALRQYLGGPAGTTDLILIAHGFRNDENDATSLYTDFLKSFRADVNRPVFANTLKPRKWAVAGIFWPSKSFSEGPSGDAGSVQGLGDESSADRDALEAALRDLRDNDANATQQGNLNRALQLLDTMEGDTAAQDEFATLVLSLTDGATPDPSEGLDQVKAANGSDLLSVLKFPVILPTSHDDSGEGGVQSVGDDIGVDFSGGGSAQGIGGIFGSIFGAAGKLLNLTTWYLMKDRSGAAGTNGLGPAVRTIRGAFPNLKIHLVGHSLGGRLMAATSKALAAAPRLSPDSLTLLEAAFSHYGFSTPAGKRPEGFFRAVMQPPVVRGPLLATFSAKDTVVGYAYAITSRLAGDNVRAIGDKDDPYGGIGRNGAQQCAEAIEQPLNTAGTPYGPFPVNKVICLDGSGGLIRDHGDITNPHVTWAFANSIATT